MVKTASVDRTGDLAVERLVRKLICVGGREMKREEGCQRMAVWELGVKMARSPAKK